MRKKARRDNAPFCSYFSSLFVSQFSNGIQFSKHIIAVQFVL